MIEESSQGLNFSFSYLIPSHSWLFLSIFKWKTECNTMNVVQDRMSENVDQHQSDQPTHWPNEIAIPRAMSLFSLIQTNQLVGCSPAPVHSYDIIYWLMRKNEQKVKYFQTPTNMPAKQLLTWLTQTLPSWPYWSLCFLPSPSSLFCSLWFFYASVSLPFIFPFYHLCVLSIQLCRSLDNIRRYLPFFSDSVTLNSTASSWEYLMTLAMVPLDRRLR